ncbi:MAG: sensor histidine kinase [Anaerolineae bacterium]
MEMEDDHIEPGLITIFRLFVVIRLALIVLTLCAWLVTPDIRTRRLPVFSLIETTFLLAYLTWPSLRKQMGRLYLPAAIAIATIGPILAYGLNVTLRIASGQPFDSLVDDLWTLIFLTLIPLIVVSWQYRFRTVVAYTLATATGKAIMAVVLAGSIAQSPNEWIALLIARTFIFLTVGYTISTLMSAQRTQRQQLAAANEKLAQANAQIAAYATTLEQLAISQERNRLARELHDTLAHSLSGVAVQLEGVLALWDSDRETAHAMLERSLGATRRGLSEARRAIHDLRASPLEDLGLALALRTSAQAIAERCNLRLDLAVPEHLDGLSPRVEQGIYRIADEALTNVARHATGATRLRVALTRQNGSLEMLVQDDGPGFDAEQTMPSGHFGLRGLQERALMIGGEVIIESEKGKGTQVRLVIEEVGDDGARAAG